MHNVVHFFTLLSISTSLDESEKPIGGLLSFRNREFYHAIHGIHISVPDHIHNTSDSVILLDEGVVKNTVCLTGGSCQKSTKTSMFNPPHGRHSAGEVLLAALIL